MGFTAAEVAEAKKAYLDARMIGRSTDGALLNLIASHEQLDRPFTWDADLEAKIQALTVDQINAAFRQAHRSERRVDREGGRLQGRRRFQVAETENHAGSSFTQTVKLLPA